MEMNLRKMFEGENKTMLYVVGGFFALCIVMIIWRMMRNKKKKGDSPPFLSKQKQKPQPRKMNSRPNTGKPKFYFSPSCHHCTKQKEILEEAKLMEQLEHINCQEDSEQCKDVHGVPHFEFMDKQLTGVQTPEKIKELIAS